MGSEYKKPDATTEITRQNFRELLWPLPIRELFTVGPATAQKCAQHGIRTIGALAEAQPAFLETFLGKSGRQLWEYANGLDESPVRRFTDEEEIKSIGNGSTFRKDLYTLDEILTAVTALSDTVATRLRKAGRKACGVKVDIKSPDFKTISRQKQLMRPTHLVSELVDAAMEILQASWQISQPIRLLTVTAINLIHEDSAEQLDFFGGSAEARERAERLRFSFKEQREFEHIEEDIAALEAHIARLGEEMAEKASDFSALESLSREKEAQERILEERMERWMYLNDLAERIAAAKEDV